MTVKQGFCSVPQGKFYIGPYGGVLQKALPVGGVITPQTSLIANEYMGNTEESKINYTLEEPQTANMDTRGAGIGCYTTYVKSAMLDLTVVSNTAETSALGNFGGVREFAAGTVTDELHAVIKGTASLVSAASKNVFVPFNRVPDVAIAYVVTNVAGSTTYVEGTDYLKGETGIEILPASTIVSSTGPLYAPTIKVSYTAVDTQRVDGLTVLSGQYALYFDGFDRMSGASRQLWAYNARPSFKASPTKTANVVKYEFSFMLLPDPRIAYSTNNPTSQYFHALNG